MNRQVNKLQVEDRAFHDWYRFVLSFPPHLVRKYLEDFGLSKRHIILDPFCGTGTTLVEAKLHGIQAFGLEANSFANFATSVKVDWEIDPYLLVTRAHDICSSALKALRTQGIFDDRDCENRLGRFRQKALDPQSTKLLLSNSISPLPLHKALTLLDCIEDHHNERYYRHFLLALANTLVFKSSNLHFGPEVGVRKQKSDAPVLTPWLSEVEKIAKDIRSIAGKSFPTSKAYLADAREIGNGIEPHSIDAVITSPPYPNEKDYTRTTRLESVILGFIKSKPELRSQKKRLIRSNTRGVYKDDDDHKWIAKHPEIHRIAESIEKRRLELGKDSGFEKLYAKVTKLYFGGMARHLVRLQTFLRPDAQLAYVVGDQASYLRVMIRTGQVLADIAESLGYELVRIDKFRTRFATATKEQLNEEVVILRWPGRKE